LIRCQKAALLKSSWIPRVFYAESGGQAGDKGVIVAGDSVFDVADTQKFEKVFVHSGTMRKGTLGKSASVKAMVDAAGRMSIARNHTATHLLQPHFAPYSARMSSSRVAGIRRGIEVRFHPFRDVKKDELDRIEQLVNGYVCDNIAVVKKEMDLEEAKKEGALAFFAEKYEEKVRVVSVPGISKEFCGGTHLDATGSIGFFKILNESSIASGVRRIEAVTGTGAFQAVKEAEQVIDTVAEMLKTPVAQIEKELEKRLKAIKDLEKQLAAQKMAGIASSWTI
jgi:alanyl-tRNA synthetase